MTDLSFFMLRFLELEETDFNLPMNKKTKRPVTHPNHWEMRQHHLTGRMRTGRLLFDAVNLFWKEKNVVSF